MNKIISQLFCSGSVALNLTLKKCKCSHLYISDYRSGFKSQMPLFRTIHCSELKRSGRGNEVHLSEEDVMIPFTVNLETEDFSEQFRNTLYPTSSDSIIIKLKSCNSFKHLIGVFNDSSKSFTSQHYCQFVLVLWDLYNPAHGVLDKKQLDRIVFMPVLIKVLDSISADLEVLTHEELVCSVLYSSRLGVDLQNPSIQSLLMKISSLLVNTNSPALSLSALSRLTIVFADNDNIWAKLFLIKTIPLIYKYFDECNNAEGLRALTIAMLSTAPYLREEKLMEYEALIDELLTSGIIAQSSRSVLVKAVMLLNTIYFKPTARHMMHQLFQQLQGEVNQLFLPHILHLQRVAFHNLEPHYAIKEIASLKQTYSMQSVRSPYFLPQFSYLFKLPHNPEGSNIIKYIINKSDDVNGLLSIQHQLMGVNLDVCNKYWSKIIQLLSAPDCETLQRVCLRYANFSFRMDSFRHRGFESHILSLITTELVHGPAVLQPQVFVIFASFVLSYEEAKRGVTNLSVEIVPRLLSMMSQLDPVECLMLSRAFKQGLLYQQGKHLHLYLQLDSALNDRTREILSSCDKTTFADVNNLLKACIYRKSSSESALMWDVLRRFKKVDWSQLTSRSIRNLVYNLHMSNCLVSSAVDHMVEYCLYNRLYIMGDTIGKLAYLCYSMNYCPQHAEAFWGLTADLVARDSAQISGLSLLNVALALSFFNHLSPFLNRLIFSVDFLEKLDEEIKHCFAKDKYPQRVRHTLMQLNRSVCLDQPEADVPWFHSKFCEEQKACGQLEPRPKTLVFTDVLSSLKTLIGDQSYFCVRPDTPYGYIVDFQLNLDSASNPLPFKGNETVAQKVALLLYYSDSFTAYERRLRGYHQLKQRHLEILGYKVIGLEDSTWNAMFMAEPKAKTDYLRKLIWPNTLTKEERVF